MMPTTEQRSPAIRQRLLQHLDQTAEFTGDPGIGPTLALPIGLDGAALAGDGSVLAVGRRRAVGKPRRLSEILPQDGPGFPGAALLRSSAEAGADSVMYHAWRDILPPRLKDAEGDDALAERDTTGRDTAFWYADLVVYQQGVLPDRQPFRSTGHWNAPGQLEIFQTLTGRVMMLIAGTAPDGCSYLTFEECEPGAITVVPPGAWHVTYCLDGPAAVFNIYTDIHPVGRARHTGRQGALDPALKYHRTAGPGTTIRLDYDGDICLDEQEHRLPAPTFTTPAWLDTVVPPTSGLASLYLHPSAMVTVLDATEEALAADWPKAITGSGARLCPAEGSRPDTMPQEPAMSATARRPPNQAAPMHPHTVLFHQAGATVLLSTDIPAAAEHARATLYAYNVDTGRNARWSVTVTVDTAAADALAPATARPVEIGPGLNADSYQIGGASVFRVEKQRTTITLDQAQRRIDVRCATPDGAVYFSARLVRQAMTAELLAAGAAYAHTAAVSVGGRGILISGHRRRGKTTTLTAILRHLQADFVGNDRLLITAEGGSLRGHAWPARMRVGIGTLLAYPDLEDLVPASYATLGPVDLWRHKIKVSVEPADFPRLIHDGTVTGSCPIDIMIWPDIAPQNQGASVEPVEPGEVRDRLLATRLFMIDPMTGISSHINQWLVPAPPVGQQATTLAGIASAIARSVPCYRLRAGGDPAALARAVAEMVPR